MIKRVLTIAGSDSSGGAGIQADLKTFHVFGVYGMSVVTAVTAQNSVSMNGVEGVSAGLVGLQFESVLTDIGIDGIKTGMLHSAEIVQVVAEKLRESRIPFVVVDPIMAAKDGNMLLERRGVDIMREALIPVATLVTPNIPEAEILCGMPVRSVEEMKDAARKIHDMGCGAVILKGGHLAGDAIDVLFDGADFFRFTARRIDTKNTHGTGCTYSAAIVANLVKGKSLPEAVRISKKFVTDAIEHSFSLGKGHGPLNHFVPARYAGDVSDE
ncbi:MAG: bifunctional hydroxymethylpyrimidine kinase/phosphomethylpyrimidine kinase [bacterium]